MNITYLIGSFGVGGKERQLEYLLKDLSKEHNIQLIIFNDDIFFKGIFDLPITIKVIQKNKKYSLKTLKVIYKTINDFNPTLIHSWSNNATLLVLPYLMCHSKVKLVSSIRYAAKLKKTLRSSFIKRLSWSRSDAIVSNSKRGLKVEDLLKHRKGILIHNGLDLISFDTKARSTAKTVNSLNGFTTKVVMVGRFYGSKDYITFIKAAKLVNQYNRKICFICIGDGPMRSKAEKEADKYLNKYIFFLGNRNDIPSLLKETDVGVLLSNTNGHAEGISNAIMEYMAAELPVIATKAGGTLELVKDNISGFLIPAFDENIVAEKVFYLIHNQIRAIEMGKAGRVIIEQDFSISKMTDAYLRLYNKLAIKKPNKDK